MSTNNDSKSVSVSAKTSESASTVTSDRSEEASVASDTSDKSVEQDKSRWKKVGYQVIEKELPPSHILYELNPTSLIQTVKEQETNFTRLILENKLFFDILNKSSPEFLEDMEDFIRRAGQISARKTTALSKKRQSLASVVRIAREIHKMPKINNNHKCDLVLKYIEEVQGVHEKIKNRCHRIKWRLTANLEEINTRKEELQESVLKFSEFKETKDYATIHKFQRFMEEWSKKSRLTADKIRLRYSSLRVQYQKLSATLAHKQLIGENLREIDFEKLRIENMHLNEKIAAKNLMLFDLKKMTGAGNLQLSQLKTVLQEKMIQKQNVIEAIKTVESNIVKADNEIVKLYEELENVKETYKRVKSRVDKYKTPEILEYVKVKAELDNSKRALKMWSRRKIIKEKALDIDVKEMKKILHCKKIYPCWFE